MLAFERADEADRILCLFNLGGEAQLYSAGEPLLDAGFCSEGAAIQGRTVAPAALRLRLRPSRLGERPMAAITMRRVSKSFGPVHVIKGVDLAIEPNEFVVFVGPSGCGKSTLLRLIAGLEDVTSGELLIGSEVVNDLPPSERGISMVFQSYALYPHMTV